MAKQKSSDAKEKIERFLRNFVLLCESQDKLELALFIFCRKLCPEVLDQRNWTCYQAAELPALVKEISQYFQKHKSSIAKAGITPKELDNFLLDLHSSRVIRNAAVHRVPLSENTMRQLGDCASRIVSLVERVAGPDYRVTLQDIQKWMAIQGWLTTNISSTSALLLRQHIISGSQQLAEVNEIKALQEESSLRRNREQRDAAEELRQQRSVAQANAQVTAQLKREIGQQRQKKQEEEAAKKREERRKRAQAQEDAQAAAQLKKEIGKQKQRDQEERAAKRKEEKRQRALEQKAARARKIALRAAKATQHETAQANENKKTSQNPAETPLDKQVAILEMSPALMIWNFMC
ncbi:hypothetical protein B0O99DRAFT_690491 [Bisporella sp. PMI_857]|nr:hypothetical protein B0O99DRAFT_690491 [Bisporella sp. PMI_857]